MRTRTAAWLTWSMWPLSLALLAVSALLQLINGPSEFWSRIVLSLPVVLTFATVGALIASRRPENLIGWSFCAFALTVAVVLFAEQYAVYTLVTLPGALPGGLGLAWVGSWLSTPAFGLLGLLLLVFPNGRLLSHRWRPLAWLYVAWAALLTVSYAFRPGPLLDVPAVGNPVGIERAAAVFDWVVSVEGGVNLLFVAAFVASVILRFRRVKGEERQQLKWFAYASVLLIVWFSVFTLLQLLQTPVGDLVVDALWGLAFAVIPISVGVAVLKQRLWDIDLLINRTVVYGALTALIAGLYILVVGGLGVLLQSRGNLVIALLATGLIALLVHPLRQRLQRGVNRLMYGERDDPYAVLSRFGQRLETTLAPEAVLPTIVETVAQTLKLPYVAIERLSEQSSVISAQWPASHPLQTPDRCALIALPLIYQDETIGQLILAPRTPGESFSASDRRLLDDLARQAGVAVHAVRLTTDLQRLTADLQLSRERLVTAREEERRRLRRDLHDGLGPALASQAFKLDAALDCLAGDPPSGTQPDPAAAAVLLRDLKTQAQALVADIRRMVYKLRPPALDELGLVAALQAQLALYASATNGLHITVEAPPSGLPPLSAAGEVAAYRIVLEGVTNVVRHAQARTCVVRFARVDVDQPGLQLEIRDDGVGLPQQVHLGVGLTAMRERAVELGGTCVIESVAVGGTRVCVWLPLPAEEA